MSIRGQLEKLLKNGKEEDTDNKKKEKKTEGARKK